MDQDLAAPLGIAQQQGLLRVDDLVSDWFRVYHPDIAEGAEIGRLATHRK